ncbi:MAG TPA: AMP-binding protein [Gaiellaceae bacterium]|nr:AMP-binding protein [Gaiellaceae bacterium]
MNLAHLLADAASGDGERPAFLHDGARIDYAELEASARRFAGLLRSTGIGPGDRVALLLPNEPAYVAAYYGALKLGAILVPLNPMLKRAEIETRLDHAEAAVLILAPGREEELAGLAATPIDPAQAASAGQVAEIVECEPGATAVILYTSGTSGGAKGAELTHRGLLANARFLAGPLLQIAPDDVLLGSPPLSHVLGQSGVMNAAIAARASVALMPRFDAAQALELIRNDGANVILGVPTMCIALLREAESLSAAPRIRVAHIGGAALAPETLHAFRDRFDCEVIEGYGMTEIAGCVAAFRFGETVKTASVGRAADGVELRIDAPPGEVGEVLIRSDSLLSGYWRNPEATRAAFDDDGWFATEDLGYLDADGCLFLVDRKKDVILRGGYTVYPREVEDVLHEHPAVREVAVVGVPDETFGEEIVALVVLKEEADSEAIKEFVRERVAGYKYPRLVIPVDALPKGPSGKILKRAIDRAPLRAELAMRSPKK